MLRGPSACHVPSIDADFMRAILGYGARRTHIQAIVEGVDLHVLKGDPMSVVVRLIVRVATVTIPLQGINGRPVLRIMQLESPEN